MTIIKEQAKISREHLEELCKRFVTDGKEQPLDYILIELASIVYFMFEEQIDKMQNFEDFKNIIEKIYSKKVEMIQDARLNRPDE